LSKEKKTSLIINALSNWVTLGLNLAIGFLLTPYIIGCLGTEGFGIWALVMSIIGYYGLLDLGVSSALIRYVARYAGQKKSDQLNEVVNTALVTYCLVGLIVVLLSFLLASPLARFFHIQEDNYESFRWVVWLLGITTAIRFPAKLFSVTILGYERFVLVNTVNIAEALLRGLFCFLVLYSGGGLIEISWVYTGLSIFVLFANFALLKLYFKHTAFSISLVKLRVARELFSFGFFTTIRHIGNILRLKLGAAIVGRCINIKAVGVYAIATLLSNYLMQLVIAAAGVTQPKLASIAGQEDKTRFPESVLRYSIIVSNLSVGFGVAAFLLAGDFIKLWVPETFTEVRTATVSFCILLVGLLPHLMTNVSVNALEAVYKHQYYAYQTILEGIANLMLSLLLVSRLGMYGVAVGAAIPGVLATCAVQPLYCCRIIGIKWSKYMTVVFVKPVLVAGGIAILFETSRMHDAHTLLGLTVKGMAITLVYFTAAYVFCLDHKTRLILLAKWRNLTCVFGAIRQWVG